MNRIEMFSSNARSSSKLTDLFIYSLLFFIICYPLQFQSIKFLLLSLILLSSILNGYKPKLSSFTFFFLIIIICYNYTNLFYFSLHDSNPVKYFVLYVFSPVIYVYILTVFGEKILKNQLIYLLSICLLFISLLDISVVASSLLGRGVGPLGDLFTGKIGIHDGYTQIVDYNIYSLFFLIPFFLIYSFRVPKNKYFIVIACMGLITAVLTGRRALWLAILASILLYTILTMLHTIKRNKWKASPINISLGLLFLLLSIPLYFKYGYLLGQLNGIWERLLDAFSETGGLGIRQEQQRVLIKDWLLSPIFGNGISVPASISRSTEFSAAYEASYHALLYQIGLFGFILYTIPVVIVLHGLLSKNRSDSLSHLKISAGISLISILIGVYSNPYFGSFDGLWMLFVPIMIYDRLLLKR